MYTDERHMASVKRGLRTRQGERRLRRKQPYRHLNLNFQTLEMQNTLFPVIRSPSLWYLIITALKR